MSFWSHSPGPFWSHWFSSLWSCATNDICVLDQHVDKKQKYLIPIPGTRVTELLPSHAIDVELLLSKHYQTFPRSRIFLKADRIRDGILYDGWIGVGVFAGAKLIGCAFSRSLGSLFLKGETMSNVGLVDFFCVETGWRKKGIASLLLQELVKLTAKNRRIVHIFMKDGLPFGPLPPIWQSQFLWRKRGLPDESKEYIGEEGVATRSQIRVFTYAQHLPYEGSIGTVPSQLSGDSKLYGFCYRGYNVSLCITDTFHRSVPEGYKIGEILWILPHGNVPKEIQELAVEALVDTCNYEIVLMDATIPHQKKKGWQKDSPYGYYIFNYNPGQFINLRPYLVP